MKKTRTTEIIIETDEVFMLRPCGAAMPVRCWCARCEKEFEMFAPELFAAFGRAGSRIVYRLVETGHLHFAETPEGAVLICPNSFGAQGSEVQPQLKEDADEDEPDLRGEGKS